MRKILPVLLVILGLLSCDKKTESFDVVDSYPTSIGNEWVYNSLSVLKIYDSETSDAVVETETISFTIKIKIEKDTVLNDTISVLQFTSIVNDGYYLSKQYCYIDSVGLKAYAYSDTTSHAYAKKSQSENSRSDFGLSDNVLSIQGLQFNSLGSELHIYEPVPRLNIKFPLELNSRWTYVTPYAPLNLQIDKKVVGYETIKIKNQAFTCYKVSWIYIENVLFDGTKVTDWISEDGLIKRQVYFKRSRFTDIETQTIKFSQLTETIELQSFK